MDINVQRPQSPKLEPNIESPAKKDNIRRKRGLKFSGRAKAIVFAVLIIGAMAGYITYQQLQLNDYRKNPTKAAQEEQSRITELVRKNYKIPTYVENIDGKDVTKEDTPEIATITDKSKLAGQTFFDKAENGDYIVVFPNSKVALIYREKTDQIINSGPVTVDTNQQAAVLNVQIFGSANDRDSAQNKIEAAFPGSTKITKLDSNSELTSTVVVDVSGNNATAAQQIADKLTNAKVGNVPDGESAPTDTDIAIYTAGQ